MPYDVKLPDIGEGIAEGEIVRWLVKAGDRVREDQPLVEVMTDNASVEIPSPRTGIVQAILAEEGQIIPVGTVIVSIEATAEARPTTGAPAGSTVATPPKTGAAAAKTESTEIPRSGEGGGHSSPGGRGTAGGGAGDVRSAATRVQATPAARELAKRLGVSLETLSGSGPGGAVTVADVEHAASPASGRSATAGSGSSLAPARDATATLEERIPLRGLRRKIAEHMTHSVHTAAHFTFVAECDMTAVVEHRTRIKPQSEAAGVKLTYLA
jgi:pyruvate/2-oxoglutarate dehydrogenase complex dihydrolipoamide acyltransferase (E2) component